MFTLRLKLDTNAYDEQVINKRFHALSHIHNVLVKHARKLMIRLQHNSQYQECLAEYKDLLKINDEDLSEQQKKRKSELSKNMLSIRSELGLTKNGLEAYIKKCGKMYSKCLSSHQVQAEAKRVWESVCDCLFSNGKHIHFKKISDFDTIGGKSNTNGVKFDKAQVKIEWLGLEIKCKYKHTPYFEEAIQHDISYCEVKRMMFPNGWHYYVILVLRGDAPVTKNHTGEGSMGIDPGVSTVAGVSESKLVLQELAPKNKHYNKQIIKLQQKMDRSLRAMNPENYNEDGTIKKGVIDPITKKKTKLKWENSSTYKKNRNKLKTLYRQKSDYTRHTHRNLCNSLLDDSKDFIVEKMDYTALAKKAKETKRQDKATEIKRKDGTTKSVNKYKKKKRFGKSINDRSPALFLVILKNKCEGTGGEYLEISTKKFKASQYRHDTDSYEKVPLSQRTKEIAGHNVQRDLYSAFLSWCTDETLEKPDKLKCDERFNKFIEMHDELINEIKQNGISMKQCFGF